jgi:DNA-binding CsgD family transcriptional regulator
MPVITSALVLAARGDHQAAADRLGEARALLAERQGGFIEGWYWFAEGTLAEERGDAQQAVTCYTRMSSWCDARGEHWMTAMRAALVQALVDAGRPEEALVEARRLRTMVEEHDLPLARLTTGAVLSAALAANGDTAAAAVEAERTLALVDTVSGTLIPAVVRVGTAGALLAAGRPQRAAELLREAETSFATVGWSRWRRRVERMLEETGSRGIARTADGRAPALVTVASNGGLSGREREVAMLAGTGMSSRAIALRLCISERTVENHLQRVYGKLAVHGRAELIARIVSGYELP